MADFRQRVLVAARAIGLFRLSRWLTRNRLRILCYHGIWLDSEHVNPFNFLFMAPERFARRMVLLRKLRYPVLPLDEALQRLEAGELPANAVVITIDDGWYGTCRHMVPELVRHGFPATIYLYTHPSETGTAVFSVALNYLLLASPSRELDGSVLEQPHLGQVDLNDAGQREELHSALCRFAEERLDPVRSEQLLETIASALGLDWHRIKTGRYFHLMRLDEARECAKDGIDFQLHTHRHRCTEKGGIRIAEEIADNRIRLERVGQNTAVHFCYPSGTWHPDYFAHLEAAGVRSATTTVPGLCTQDSERFALPRVLDGDRVSDIEFEAELCGMMEIRRRVFKWFRS